jgi:acyl-CoA synthetase (AMP-forming)/AMP-acid ligase II
MLRRMLDLDPSEGTLAGSGVRIIALSGSALPGELAVRATERYGHVLYTLYGSTEVAWATIADPADIAAAPGTAGRPPRGPVLRLYDEEGNEVGPGEVGEIIGRSPATMSGYHNQPGKTSEAQWVCPKTSDRYIRTGDVVDVVGAAGPEENARARVVAANAVVVLVSAKPESIGAGNERVVMVALPGPAAQALAAATLVQTVTLTIH